MSYSYEYRYSSRVFNFLYGYSSRTVGSIWVVYGC